MPPAKRSTRRFPAPVLRAIDAAQRIGIRAGREYRFIAVWAVVVNGRVFARSWEISRDGWYHAFLEEPRGAITVGDREIRIRAVPARGERLRDAIDRAYLAKYTSPGSVRYARGFRSARRRATTVELVPR
ncbi:MAG TPA: DUF2255 family protein [Gemmatimonadaceae bacterium]